MLRMSAFGILPSVGQFRDTGAAMTRHRIYLLLHVLAAVLWVGRERWLAVLPVAGAVAGSLVARLAAARIRASAATVGVS